MEETKKRKSNFELLRIFSILLVITSHFNAHGEYLNNLGNFNFNLIIKTICTMGTIANLIFIIITGYFMFKSKPNYKKIIGLILDMMFYSYIIFAVLFLFRIIKPSGSDVFKTIFPMLYGNGFIIYYMILYMFIPILNHLINNISKENMEKLLFIMILLISIIPTFSKAFGFSNHAIFVLGYFIGGYIGKYCNKEINKRKIKKVLLLDLVLLIISSAILYFIEAIKNNNWFVLPSTHFIASNNSIFVIIIAICIFLLFKDMKIKYNKIINNIANSVLGIYLIHDNSFIRPLIWTKIFPNNDYFSQWYFFIFAIIKILSVFFICLLIDMIRIKLFKRIRQRIIDILYEIIYKVILFIYKKFNIFLKIIN